MFKMKKIALSLLFIPFVGLAQDPKISPDYTVTAGTPYEVIDAGSKEYISLDNGFVYMAKMRGEIVTLQKYDVANMKEVSRNTYEDLPKYAKFLDFIKVGEKLYYIIEGYDKKTKQFTVYSREIDPSDASFKTQKELFTTSRAAKNSPAKTNMVDAGVQSPFSLGGLKFLVKQSFDQSKIMIHYTLAPLEKDDSKNYDDLGFYVFDSNMDKVWGSEVKMPYTEANMNNVCYSVSSKGDVKMLITNNNSKSYELLSVNEAGKVSSKDLGLSTDQLVREFQMKEDESGNFICGGFYANGIEIKVGFGGAAMVFNANGLMYFEMSNDGDLIKHKNFDFTEKFIKQNLNDRLKKDVEEREKDGKAGILDLNLTNFVVKEDGSAFFVGERQYIRNEMYGTSQQSVYHFSNVVLIKVDSEGELAWMKKLPKNQAGVAGAGQMSISYMETKTSDYVAYIDNPKNINLDANGGIPEAHKDGAGGFLTTYKVNHNDGSLEKHTLLDLKNVPGGYTAYQFKASRIINCGNGTFLLEIYIKGKQDTMVKFQLK